jgi:hypothetical protein
VNVRTPTGVTRPILLYFFLNSSQTQACDAQLIFPVSQNGQHSGEQNCHSKIKFFKIGIAEWGGVHLGPLGTAATNRPTVPAPGDYDDGEIGGRMIGRGYRNTRRKPAPVPLCPPQTPHAARTRTRAAAVGSQRLTT